MMTTWVRRAALLGALVGSGCGEGDAKPEKEDVEQASTCGDGESCVDKAGAPTCPVDSGGYEGDELALCNAKDETEGLSLHYGPKNYDDEAEVEKYLLEPFGEDENCVYVRTTNKEDVWVNRYHGRMRPYSHHLIVTVVDELPDGVELGEPTSCRQTESVGARWLLGSQDPQIDLEVEGAAEGSEPAQPGDPEYRSGQLVKPNTLLRIDMHYVNTTDKPILRESWVYLKAVPASEVETVVDMITFFQGSISIPPQSTGTKTAIARCRAPSDRYIGMATGHFHEYGTRFTMWHEKPGQEPEMVYDTSDWDLPGNAIYSDRIKNPGFDEGGIWAAKSGYLFVEEGDYINFQCEFDNPSNETVTLGELGRDQMCNVFGMYFPSDGDVWNCACFGGICF